MDLLGIGSGELLLILLVGLIFVGPDKLVGFARSVGKLMRRVSASGKEFSTKLHEEIDLETQAKELLQAGKDISGALNQAVADMSGVVSRATGDASGALSEAEKEVSNVLEEAARDAPVPVIQARRVVSGGPGEQVTTEPSAQASGFGQAANDVSGIVREGVALGQGLAKEQLSPAGDGSG
jgi:sec-independent protein translocase protein TatB